MSDTSSEATAGRQTISFYGMAFDAPAPYHEGHVLTANEAVALNQTFGENLRNNFARQVKNAVEFARESARASGGPEPEELPPEVLEKLRSDFAEYASNYTFSTRPPKVISDPSEHEAIRLAKIILKTQDSSLTAAEISERVDDLLEARPEIREEAKRRMSVVQSLAQQTLGVFPEEEDGAEEEGEEPNSEAAA